MLQSDRTRLARAVRMVERTSPASTSGRRAPRELGSGQQLVVRVKNDGGSNGGVDTPCTYTYSIFDLADAAWNEPDATPLAMHRTPWRPTFESRGLYERAPDGSLGIAVIDPLIDGPDKYVLLFTQERLITSVCDASW